MWVEKILITWRLLEILESWSINISFLSFPPKWGLCLSLILLSTACPPPPTGEKNENILSLPLFSDSQWFPKLFLNWHISQLYIIGNQGIPIIGILLLEIKKKLPLFFGFLARIEKYIVIFPVITLNVWIENVYEPCCRKKVQMNRSLVSFMSTRNSNYSPWELELKLLINPHQVIPDAGSWTGITVLWIYSCLQSMVR